MLINIERYKKWLALSSTHLSIQQAIHTILSLLIEYKQK
jgi:hypothetical protein